MRKAFPNALTEPKSSFSGGSGKAFPKRCELTTGRNL
jgi:hypothetical protein